MLLRDYVCHHCGEMREDELVHDIEEVVRCECGMSMEWYPTPIDIRTDNSKTYLDGTKRKGFAELKEQLALEDASHDLPFDKRGDINREIQKIGGS